MLLNALKENPFLLAPMAGITDSPFRSFMRELGCGVVTSELVSATGLKFNSEKTRRIMSFTSDQHPVGIQIFGDKLEDFAFAASEVEKINADFVDLNFGCPVPKVVKKGGGSAVLKDLKRVSEIFQTMRKSTYLPVTVKIRTGWDRESINAVELAKIAYEEGLSWVSIHGRTRAQGYAGQADWDYIAEVKSLSKIPIIGNGDITSARQANLRLRESGCDGVMIGRGCLKNPWIFQEAMGLYTKKQDGVIKRDFHAIIQKLTTNLESFCPEQVVILQIKKFSSWYSSGYPDSALFRKNIFQIKEKSKLIEYVRNYFNQIQHLLPQDTSEEPFLMGGHG